MFSAPLFFFGNPDLALWLKIGFEEYRACGPNSKPCLPIWGDKFSDREGELSCC